MSDYPYVPPRDFFKHVSVTLERDVKITTQRYVPRDYEEEEWAWDDTSDTNWAEEYNESCYTIPDLLAELRCYLKEDLERYKGHERKERELKMMLEAAEGWSLCDMDIDDCK